VVAFVDLKINNNIQK